MEFCLYTVLVLTLSTTAVLGLPTGAPETACATLMPVGHDALDNQATGDVPFDVDISDLGPGPCYIPGDMYEIVLSGGMQQNTDFRGFIIQAQTVADGSPVGSFMGGTNSQPVCTSDTAATHTNRDEKTMVTLTWTAPPEGTGAIRFVVTFVDRYSPSNNLNVFWAGVETAMISEGNCLFFNPAMYTVNETAGVVQPAIYINTPLPSDLTIEVTSNDGTATGGDVDYMSGPYSVILPTNMTYVTFNISINDDTMSEQNENFTLTITNTALPSGVTVGYPDQATVTIVDDDPTYVMFNESAYNVDEDDGPVTPAVVLSRLPSTEVIIQVTNTGGSATGGVDYMSGPYSVTFAVNVTSAEFNIDIINDTMYEGNENFMLTFVQSTLPPGFFVGSIDQATVTIMEDDPPLAVMFSQSAYSVDEDAGPVQPMVVINRVSANDTTFEVYDTNGTAGSEDYTPGPYCVTILAGETHARFNITINNDDMSEYNENFTLNINASSLPTNVSVGNIGEATVTIVDDDTQPTLSPTPAGSAGVTAASLVMILLVISIITIAI